MSLKFKGQALVEMAFLLPVFLLLAFGMVDLGRAFYYQEAIANAAREGARYGATTESPSSSDIATKAKAEAGALGSSLTVASNIQTVASGVDGRYVEVTVTYPFNLVTPVMQNLIGNQIVLSATNKMPSATTFP